MRRENISSIRHRGLTTEFHASTSGFDACPVLLSANCALRTSIRIWFSCCCKRICAWRIFKHPAGSGPLEQSDCVVERLKSHAFIRSSRIDQLSKSSAVRILGGIGLSGSLLGWHPFDFQC